MAKHSSAVYEQLAAKARRREQARIQSQATKPLPADGSPVRSKALEEYAYHSLWARTPDRLASLIYKVGAVANDVKLVGGEAVCGIALAAGITPESMPGVRSSGVSANRLFWYAGAAQAIYRHTATGNARAQYYNGKASATAEHVRSHHSVILSTVSPPPNISGILLLYDNIVKGKGKELMVNKNGRLWLEVETATKQFEQNGT